MLKETSLLAQLAKSRFKPLEKNRDRGRHKIKTSFLRNNELHMSRFDDLAMFEYGNSYLVNLRLLIAAYNPSLARAPLSAGYFNREIVAS